MQIVYPPSPVEGVIFIKTTHTIPMPAIYTHYIVAKENWSNLPNEVAQKLLPYQSLYFFGANGPDFCFFYNFLDGKSNLGSFLHKEAGIDVFRVLKAFARTPDMLAYSLGFITHYAADLLFHPFVYRVSKNSLLKHTRIENALDEYFKKSVDKDTDSYYHYFAHKLSPKEEKELFLLYAAIAVRCGFPPIKQTAFFRAIQLFNAYMPLPNAFFGKEKDWGDTVIGEGEKDKKLADDLFRQAIMLSTKLCKEFLHSLQNQTPLPSTLFQKSYLTGEVIFPKRRI